jgi:hypothetical protein
MPTVIARPFQLIVVVVKPSGASVEAAKTSVTWEGAPPFTEVPKSQEGETNKLGRFSFGRRRNH